jgi:hypothetical protein
METITRKKRVPEKWYKEMSNEYASHVLRAKPHIRQLQDRIKAIKESGLDYEIRKLGSTEHKISIEFLENALKEAPTYEQQKKRWLDFKSKYEPVKGLEGNLKAAKLETENRILKGKLKFDGYYKQFHEISDKYYLSEKQMNILMDYFYKKDLF